MKLISSTIMLNAFCALLLSCKPAVSDITAEPKAEADWSHVKLYGHAFSNNEFTQEEYQFIAEKMPIFTVEKRHAHKVHGSAKSEQATLSTARKIKALNPDATVLFYASDIANDPAVGGVFVDASSKAALNGQLDIVHKLMDELPGLVLYNGYRVKP